MAADRFSLQKGDGGQYKVENVSGGEIPTGAHLTPNKRSEGVTKPNLKMFGGLVPHNCRPDYKLAEKLSANGVERYGRGLDERLLTAVTVGGIHPCHWRRLDYALARGQKPFDMRFKKPESLSWIEVAQKIIPYVNEAFLPALNPSWMRRFSYSQHMYLAHLKVFWMDLAPCYSDPWELTLEFDLSGTQRYVNYLLYHDEEGKEVAARKEEVRRRRSEYQNRRVMEMMDQLVNNSAYQEFINNPIALDAAVTKAAQEAGAIINQEMKAWDEENLR